MRGASIVHDRYYLSTMLPRSSMYLKWHKEKRHRHRRLSLPLKGLLLTSRYSLVLCATDRLTVGDGSSVHWIGNARARINAASIDFRCAANRLAVVRGVECA